MKFSRKTSSLALLDLAYTLVINGYVEVNRGASVISGVMQKTMSDLEEELYSSLFDAYGPVMTGKPLWSSLGYISDDAFRMSISRGEMPIPLFSINKRRGRYALVREVARFLAQQRLNNLESPKRKEVLCVTAER